MKVVSSVLLDPFSTLLNNVLFVRGELFCLYFGRHIAKEEGIF